MRVRLLLIRFLRPNGKVHFLEKLDRDSSILDVGCGNNSPYQVKSVVPHSTYTGLDIGDYNQTKPNKADRYILTSPDEFAREVGKFNEEFDAVISSHNLEHCNDRYATFLAMLRATRVGGRMYVAFPSERSVSFPHRAGTLNYFDDSTHKDAPPDFDRLLKMSLENGFEVLFATRGNQSWLLRLIGLLSEPISRYKKKVLHGTWEYYGFESIIILKRVRLGSHRLQ